MEAKYSGRYLSFKVLERSSSASENDSSTLSRLFSGNGVASSSEEPMDDRKRRRRKEAKRKRKKMKSKATDMTESKKSIVISNSSCGSDASGRGRINSLEDKSHGSASAVVAVVEEESADRNVRVPGELRQRIVRPRINLPTEESTSGTRVVADEQEDVQMDKPNLEVKGKQNFESNESLVSFLETSESSDWKRLIAEDNDHVLKEKTSPWKFLMEEIYSGYSIRSTTAIVNEKEREKLYDTIFQLPWRCEALIIVGFFVCFNSFLSLLTITPVRVLTYLLKTYKRRKFERPSAAELSDFGCLMVLACGVLLLGWIDISLIYHMIRGQGAIKLYVVYNVLEIFDKLCLSACGDVFQVLFGTAEQLSTSSDNTEFWIRRFISNQALAIAASVFHSVILLVQAITLAACIVAHNNALLALLVSNNFAEIKSNVFKRFSKENVQGVVYSDAIERFHIFAFLLFVLAQNILEADGPWFGTFLFNAASVLMCEMLIDTIKHSFLAKFNGIKPSTYSGFLEELCKQTLNILDQDRKKALTFIPMAPACVVIRVLTPTFVAHLPCAPVPWRMFCVVVMIGMAYVALVILKLLVGCALQKHAAWYVNRCWKKKTHSD